MKLERHPLGAANRPLTEQELSELRAHICDVGILRPILLFEGKVLDGWNRYSISQDIGCECPMTAYEGSFEEARELVFAIESGRSLSMEERLLLRARLDALLPPARGGRSAPGADQTAKSAEAVAKDLGTSVRQVSRARAVAKKGSEELQRAVEAGKVSLKRAADIAQLPREDQAAAIEAPAPRRGTPEAGEQPARRRAVDIPAPKVGPTQEAYDELQEKHQILVEEFEAMERRLAAHFSEGTEEERAALKILAEEQAATIKSLQAELDAVKATRDNYLSECTELRRQCAYYRNQLKKTAAA